MNILSTGKSSNSSSSSNAAAGFTSFVGSVDLSVLEALEVGADDMLGGISQEVAREMVVGCDSFLGWYGYGYAMVGSYRIRSFGVDTSSLGASRQGSSRFQQGKSSLSGVWWVFEPQLEDRDYVVKRDQLSSVFRCICLHPVGVSGSKWESEILRGCGWLYSIVKGT